MTRRLHVALVHPYSWPEVRRGGERYLADLAWYLAGRNHRVEVITGTDGSPTTSTEGGVVVRRFRSVRHLRLERRGIAPTELFGIPALAHLLGRRFDLVHALTPAGALAAKLAGHRTIYTVLGHPARELVGTHPRLPRWLMRRAIRTADVVAGLSGPSAAAVEDSFGRRAEVLSPGVRLVRFPPRIEARLDPVLLFPAFASNPHKGLATLLEAFALLHARLPGARLRLGGPGDPAWAFAALGPAADALREAVEVVGAGTLEDVPRLYREAAVTALPSLYEAFGLVLVESLASGTPVVCSSTSGGMTDIVDRPEVGRAVPFGDAAALAQGLEETLRLASDPLTPRRCRDHAARWGWSERVGPAHESLYLELAAPRRRRSPRSASSVGSRSGSRERAR